MKRFISIFLTISLLVFACCSCGASGESQQEVVQQQVAQDPIGFENYIRDKIKPEGGNQVVSITVSETANKVTVMLSQVGLAELVRECIALGVIDEIDESWSNGLVKGMISMSESLKEEGKAYGFDNIVSEIYLVDDKNPEISLLEIVDGSVLYDITKE